MGYNMYKEAIEQTPIEQKVESIRNTEGFTEYDDIPKMYVDAVISVEDHRFWSHNALIY